MVVTDNSAERSIITELTTAENLLRSLGSIEDNLISLGGLLLGPEPIAEPLGVTETETILGRMIVNNDVLARRVDGLAQAIERISKAIG